MRIKINDKIYRLEENESGVDSLMELVEEPQFKDGDFVVSEAGNILIFRKEVGDSIYDHAFLGGGWLLFTNLVEPSFSGIKRYATEAEKQKLLDALAKKGKRWNAEKLCVEDIPDELKKGDLAIFWDGGKQYARVGVYSHRGVSHFDHTGVAWAHALKFESKEQYERFIKGEI